MNILFCYMYQHLEGPGACQSSADSMVNGFKAIGHKVTTCGPSYKNFSGELAPGHDIPVYDCPDHPEIYTYDEIVGAYVAKYGYKPDLIIQTDPHFYLVGEKPDGVVSVYWIMDVHRGPIVFRRMAVAGNFDKVFIAQKYYMPIFKRVLDCDYLAWAYDDTLVCEHPEIEIQCDIVFIGTTGLRNEDKYFGAGITSYDKRLKLEYLNLADFDYADFTPERKFSGWNNRSMEYAERIEHLLRLSYDFDVRIYQRCFDLERVAKVLSRGKIGFHHSLRRDITLRVFEILAVNRLLIADNVPYLEDVLTDGVHFGGFRPYYQPQFPGFDFDYEEVKGLVDYCLKHEDMRKKIARQGMEHVKKNHTFENRAKEMIGILFKG